MIFRILAFTAFLAATTLAFYEAPDDCDWDFIDEESGFAGKNQLKISEII